MIRSWKWLPAWIACQIAITAVDGNAQGLVTSGSRIGGSISVVGEIDSWSVEVPEGATLRAGVGKLGGVNFEPLLRVTDADGQTVASNSGAGSTAVTHTATGGGVFTVALLDASSTPNATGSYEVFFTVSEGSFVIPPGDEGGAIASGESAVGTISLGDMDLYSFEASAGQEIRVSTGESSGSGFMPHLLLYGPDGEAITSNSGTASTDVAATATVAGTYMVVIQDGNADVSGSGDYELYLAVAGQDFVVPPGDEGGVISSGESAVGSIRLGDMDLYSFEASAGQGIRVSTGESSGSNFRPYLMLHGPDGGAITSNSGTASADLTATAAVAGTYTVVIRDGNVDVSGSGDYELYLAVAGRDFSVPPEDEGGAISSGGSASGSISLGDMDLYSFEAWAGQEIRVSTGESSGSGFMPYLILYGPDGGLITSNSGSSSTDVAARATVAGTYMVVIQDGNVDVSGSGNYDLYVSVAGQDFVVPPGDEGGMISSGESAVGTIRLGDMDLYSFEASAGQGIRVSTGESSGSNFRPYLILYGPDGGLIISNGGSSSTEVAATATVEGTYMVVIQDGNVDVSGSGDYELYLAVAGQDFVVPPGDEGGAISSGESTSGTISLGDMDSFSFQANAGDVMTAGIEDVTGSGLNPGIVLYGPDGGTIASDSGTAEAEISATLGTAGSYLLVVRDFNVDASGTGDYSLAFTKTAAPVGIPGGSDEGLIHNGGFRDGSIGVAGDVDRWTFAAAAGESVRVQVGELSGVNFNPSLAVFGPDGAPVALDVGSNSASVSFVATAAGIHTAVVRESDDNQTGAYRVFLARSAAPSAVPPGDEGGMLANGAGESAILALGDLDVWDFEVAAGDAVRVQVGELTGVNFTPFLEVYDPAGNLVARESGAVSASVVFRALSGGAYRAVVREDGGNESGTYRIHLARTSAGFTIPGGDEGGILGNGAGESAALTLGDLDIWDFDVAAGDAVRVQMGELTGVNFAPFLEVYDPAGNLVARDSGAVSAGVYFRALSGGAYRAVVREDGGNESGTYRIHLARTSAGFVVPSGDEGGTLTNGTSKAGAVTLGDLDFWDFEVPAGAPVWMQVGELTGVNFVPFLEVYDPAGNLVARDSGSVSASVFFRTLSSGTYRALVREDGGNESGTYRVHLSIPSATFTIDAGDEGGVLENGRLPNGNLSLGDLDTWAFSATTGDVVEFSLTEISGVNFSPVLSVYGPDGGLVAQASGSMSATLRFTVPSSGRHTLVVRESGGDASGTYELVAIGIVPAPVVLTLRRSETVPGRLIIEWPSPSDGWILEESPTLLPDDWNESALVPTSNGITKSVEIDPGARDRLFFRLVRQ